MKKNSLRTIMKTILLTFILAAVSGGVTGCSGKVKPPIAAFDINSVKTYRDIPGITQEEINAIEELKNAREKFSYGQPLSTESFILHDGTYAGFAVKYCKLLSDLFGIEFAFELYEWEELMRRINDKTLDFTGDLTPTAQRMQTYHMTYPIAERALRIFTTEDGYGKILDEQDAKDLKIGFLEGTIHAERINYYYPDLNINFVPVYSTDIAVDMLQSGELDAFIDEGVYDPSFNRYGVVRSREFFSRVYMSVSMATANEDLQPILSAIDNYIAAGGIDVLFDLYRQGNEEYARYKLADSFTEEERVFLENLKTSGSTVKVALEEGNYPICFFDKTTGKFDGIAVEMLEEISKLTGMVFETANDEKTSWTQILSMLREGEVSMVSELLHSREREGHFLWAARPYFSSYFALISRYNYPNLLYYQVVRTKVGTMEGVANADKYKEWFPANDNLVLYKNTREVFDALEAGEIDLMIGSEHMLLMQQNYYQKPGFKINILFTTPMESFFGFNINENVLCGIVSKTQDFVRSDIIIKSWTGRGYDYAAQMARQRTMYFMIIAIVLAVMFIISIIFLLLGRRRRGIISKLLDKTRQISDYELIKHGLTIKAMNIGLWDKEISGMPAKGENPFDSASPFRFSKEFRQMLGYTDENDFPNIFSSCINSIHHDDKDRVIGELVAHLTDLTGKTAFDTELRLLMKDGKYRIFSLYGSTLRDETGAPLRIAGAIKDITEEKLMTQEIEHNRELLSAVNTAAAFLLNTDSDSFEIVLYQGMRVMVKAVGADRMYIWKNHIVNGELCATQLYEWSEGTEPQQGNEYTVDIPYNKNIQGIEEILSNNLCLNGIVREMSPGHQAQLVPQGIVSIIIVPIFLKNEFWGFVGFDDCRNERIFTEQEEAILRSGSLLFAHAYQRNETSEQLKKAMDEAHEANRLKQISINSLESILNSIDSLIYVTVPETGELLFINNVMKKLFGIENDNFAGKYCYKAFRNMENMCEFCPCYKLNENPEQTVVWEEYIESLDSNFIHSDCYIDWPDGRKVHLQHAVDITELTRRKMAEEEYRAASEAKSRFLATMSHEIRTPMNVILGSTESLLENDSHSKETREVLEKIYNSGDMLIRIINDILDLSKIEANKFEIIPTKYDIASLINDSVNLNILKYAQKDITLKLHVDEKLPLFLFGDELRIKQIINNLLSNAFKYTDSGEVSVSFSRQYLTDEKITLVIGVSDTGQGMTGEQVEKLFSEYTRFNLEANRTTVGTGLGLAITKNLLRLMNGDIKVESSPGKGSVFTVSIPQLVIDSRVLGSEAADNFQKFRFADNVQRKKVRIVREPMPYGKVLIVDDMKSNIDVAKLLLQPYQLQIDAVESGFEAIDLIKSGKTYDIVFMDHMMPKMDGIETVKRIREWEREQLSINNYQLSINNEHSPIPDPQSPVPSPRSPLPIIALTANAIVGQAGMFLENGFNGCITKPIDTRELNAVLNEYVRDKKPAGY